MHKTLTLLTLAAAAGLALLTLTLPAALAETPRRQNDGIDMHHRFCARCGTRLWTEGDIPELGGRFVMVCVGALDGVPEAELVAAPIYYADGAHDNWAHPAAETRHL